METSINKRISYLRKFLNFKSGRSFAEQIGISSTTFNDIEKGSKPNYSTLEKIMRTFPDISAEWLLTGKGDIFKQISEKKEITSNYIIGTATNIESNMGNFAPIVPSTLARNPQLDVLEFLTDENNITEISSIQVHNTPISLWYRIQDNSLYPNYQKGDMIALWSYPQGEENPIPGKLYVVDTYSNGMIARILLKQGEDFLARAINSEEYPDFIIKRSDIIRIFKQILMVRM